MDAELADDATSALQNLALKSKLQDRQELPSGATHSNIPPTDPRNSSTGIHLGDTCVSERVPGDEKQGNKEKQEVSICTTKMMLSTDQDKDQSTSTKDTLPGKTTDERRHSNKTIIHAGNCFSHIVNVSIEGKLGFYFELLTLPLLSPLN